VGSRRIELRILRLLMRHADAVIPISALMGEDLVAEGWCRPERVHPFGMGVTTAARRVPSPPSRSPGDRLRLVYIGTLDRSRGLERLLDAVVLARDRHGVDVELSMFGGTPEQVRAMRQEVVVRRLSDRVDVPGRLPRHDLYSRMASCHAAAIFIGRDPRYRIASTTKLLESLAVGLPCVATDAVAMHVDVAAASGAVLLSDDTAEGFAGAIARLESDWEVLAARAVEERDLVQEWYSYDRARERMDSLVTALVNGG